MSVFFFSFFLFFFFPFSPALSPLHSLFGLPLIIPPYSAFLVCDRIGRIWATRELCLVWIVGIAIFMGNGGSLGAVYAGRFIAGLGVGQTVVVAPVYLAEIVSSPPPTTKLHTYCRQAPAAVRGLCTCVFTGFVYLGRFPPRPGIVSCLLTPARYRARLLRQLWMRSQSWR